MSRTLQTVAWVACAGLLLAILLVLVDIGRRGVRIELAGEVHVTGMKESIALSMPEPVRLVMEESAGLVVSGPEGEAVPAALSLVACPVCGAPMVPVRWSPWTGEIEWLCPACGARLTPPADSE